MATSIPIHSQVSLSFFFVQIPSGPINFSKGTKMPSSRPYSLDCEAQSKLPPSMIRWRMMERVRVPMSSITVSLASKMTAYPHALQPLITKTRCNFPSSPKATDTAAESVVVSLVNPLYRFAPHQHLGRYQRQNSQRRLTNMRVYFLVRLSTRWRVVESSV